MFSIPLGCRLSSPAHVLRKCTNTTYPWRLSPLTLCRKRYQKPGWTCHRLRVCAWQGWAVVGDSTWQPELLFNAEP
jgi:hypothetical protein